MEQLTRRQQEVASLVAQGLTNRDIATQLVISERTAEGHIEQIRRKLSVHSRTQIANWVRRDGTDSAAVSDSPQVRYARNGGVDIAYHLLGLEAPDLLAFSSSVLPIDSMHEEPSLARFHNRLASFSRLIRFDLRGVGMSDPVVASSPPTLEQWMGDAVAVMDGAGLGEGRGLCPPGHLVGGHLVGDQSP